MAQAGPAAREPDGSAQARDRAARRPHPRLVLLLRRLRRGGDLRGPEQRQRGRRLHGDHGQRGREGPEDLGAHVARRRLRRHAAGAGGGIPPARELIVMRLAGKAALISGGARGMGAAEARLFAREGARVVIGDILEDEGKAVETDIKAKGGEALSIKLDVTREADWQRAVEAAVSRFGRLDILVNNAGIGGGGRPQGTTTQARGRPMENKTKGGFLRAQAPGPPPRRPGGGP